VPAQAMPAPPQSPKPVVVEALPKRRSRCAADFPLHDLLAARRENRCERVGHDQGHLSPIRLTTWRATARAATCGDTVRHATSTRGRRSAHRALLRAGAFSSSADRVTNLRRIGH